MTENHSHIHPTNEISESRLLLASLLNFVITAVQIAGGFLANSLSLISDAVHNLGDGLAVLLAYIANRIGKKKSTLSKTFGYQRIEILTALLNGVILVSVSILLFIEAVQRMINPEPIKGLLMFIVASVGLIANIASVFILKKDATKNLNVKAAYLHLIGDTLSSIVVILGGIFIYFFKIYWIDPLLTILIGLYIIIHTWDIVKQTLGILMQSAPKNLNLKNLKQEVEKFDNIDNIHHIHAWNLTDTQTHFECHIDLKEDLTVSQTDELNKQISAMLKEKFNIDHVTMQFEYNLCQSKSLLYHS